jgi:DNA-directed RNA polymerase specialized sigma54-like protein
MRNISMKASKEIILSKKKMYQKATRKGKSLILSGLQEAIGLSRKHLSRVLNGSYEYENCQYKKSARGRKAKYNQEHTKILVVLWQLLDYPCASRLKGSLKDTLDNLISCGHITISKSLYRDLMSISSATINRLLKPERRTLDPFGIATTKPGSMLKKQIPIRRGTDWDDAIPGFVEIDLVAHCGSSTKGDYVNTLDCTDVKSGWTECYAVINKARTHTLNAMKAIQQRLPFPLKGVDSDNGSYFFTKNFLYFAK